MLCEGPIQNLHLGPGEKSQLPFQDIPDVQLCNITAGILDPPLIARGVEDPDLLEAIKKGFFLQVTCNEPSCYLQSFGKCETAAPKRGWSCTKIYHSCPYCHSLLQEQLWGFLEQKNRENSPMNSWDRGTTYCCPRITHTSSAQMRWAVRRPTQSLSFGFSPRAEPAPCMVWGLSRDSSVLLQLCPQTHPGCVQGHLCALCVLRDITKELPSVAMAEGWPQHGPSMGQRITSSLSCFHLVMNSVQ